MTKFAKDLAIARIKSKQDQKSLLQRGAASVEYAILVALVVVVIFAVVSEYDITDAYVTVSAKVKAAL